MRKLAILHFNPLELYPPVMNILRVLAGQKEMDLSVRVYTTATDESVPEWASGNPFIRIFRKGTMHTAHGNTGRASLYARYYTSVGIDLLRWRPDTVLVFETLSFFPAWLYKRSFGRNARLMIHYHEYMSKSDYAQGMRLNKWFHRLEQRLYPRTVWVSHTNAERMRRFLEDNTGIRIPAPHIVPNYPPGEWTLTRPRPIRHPTRIVYIGSLGLDSMYVREFADWIISQGGHYTWDIYVLHLSSEAREYLASLDQELIRFRGSCYYYDLPALLVQYDVGVVLYKGVMPNHIYAVSNKVLEYIACGLDVWYAREMLGTGPYITADHIFPRIIPVDFTSMKKFDAPAALSREGMQYRPSPYLCEEALAPMLEMIRGAGSGGTIRRPDKIREAE